MPYYSIFYTKEVNLYFPSKISFKCFSVLFYFGNSNVLRHILVSRASLRVQFRPTWESPRNYRKNSSNAGHIDIFCFLAGALAESGQIFHVNGGLCKLSPHFWLCAHCDYKFSCGFFLLRSTSRLSHIAIHSCLVISPGNSMTKTIK